MISRFISSSSLFFTAFSPTNLTDFPPPVSTAYLNGSAICLCYFVLQPKILGFPLNSTKLLSLTSVCLMSDPNSNANSSPEKLCSGSESHPPYVMGSAEEPPQPSLSNVTTTVSSVEGDIISEELRTIRPLKMTDASDAVKWLMDKEASRFCPWYAFESKEEAAEYFQTEYFSYSKWHHAICISDKAVGSICVEQLDKDDKCRAEVAYVVSPEYWGRGLATWAVKEAAKKVFADQEFNDLLRLEALVDVDNVASQRVVEKAGFTKEGVLRKYLLMKEIPKDIVIFSFLRTDPAPT